MAYSRGIGTIVLQSKSEKIKMIMLPTVMEVPMPEIISIVVIFQKKFHEQYT